MIRALGAVALGLGYYHFCHDLPNLPFFGGLIAVSLIYAAIAGSFDHA